MKRNKVNSFPPRKQKNKKTKNIQQSEQTKNCSKSGFYLHGTTVQTKGGNYKAGIVKFKCLYKNKKTHTSTQTKTHRNEEEKTRGVKVNCNM